MTSAVHVIKRYANRKLYDPRQSRYITLDEIAELIDAGEEVRIIDNKTKEDITGVTLAQVLVEREKKRRNGRPMPALRGLIKNTGETLSRRITEPVTTLRTSVEESVGRLIRTGEERAAETRGQIQSWVEHNQAMVEDFQRQVDGRIKNIVSRLDLLAQMRSQVEALEARVAELEAHLGLPPVARPTAEPVAAADELTGDEATPAVDPAPPEAESATTPSTPRAAESPEASAT